MTRRTEWALRDGGGVSRVLMVRYCDERGCDVYGNQVIWRDIATFPRHMDADLVIGILQGGDA